MKIENSISSVPAAAQSEANSRATVAKNADNKPAPATQEMGTSVSLGSTTAQLRSLGSGANAPEIDADKVAAIKKAISEGRFQVNSGAVADRLLSSVRDLINASQH